MFLVYLSRLMLSVDIILCNNKCCFIIYPVCYKSMGFDLFNDAIPLLRNNPCMSKCMECEMTNLLYDDRSLTDSSWQRQHTPPRRAIRGYRELEIKLHPSVSGVSALGAGSGRAAAWEPITCGVSVTWLQMHGHNIYLPQCRQ